MPSRLLGYHLDVASSSQNSTRRLPIGTSRAAARERCTIQCTRCRVVPCGSLPRLELLARHGGPARHCGPGRLIQRQWLQQILLTEVRFLLSGKVGHDLRNEKFKAFHVVSIIAVDQQLNTSILVLANHIDRFRHGADETAERSAR